MSLASSLSLYIYTYIYWRASFLSSFETIFENGDVKKKHDLHLDTFFILKLIWGWQSLWFAPLLLWRIWMTMLFCSIWLWLDWWLWLFLGNTESTGGSHSSNRRWKERKSWRWATTKGMFFFWNLPETNPASLHLKIDGLEDDISFEGRQTVSFWEVILTLTGRHVRHTSLKNQSKQKNMKKPHSDDAFQRATKPVNLLPAQPSAGNMFFGIPFRCNHCG